MTNAVKNTVTNTVTNAVTNVTSAVTETVRTVAVAVLYFNHNGFARTELSEPGYY